MFVLTKFGIWSQFYFVVNSTLKQTTRYCDISFCLIRKEKAGVGGGVGV